MSDVTAKWQRSTFCSDAACVEVADIGDGVAMRDGKDVNVTPITFDRDDWAAFTTWVSEQDWSGRRANS